MCACVEEEEEAPFAASRLSRMARASMSRSSSRVFGRARGGCGGGGRSLSLSLSLPLAGSGGDRGETAELSSSQSSSSGASFSTCRRGGEAVDHFFVLGMRHVGSAASEACEHVMDVIVVS